MEKSRIESCILTFHRKLLEDNHHRYRSWGHCYRYFRRVRFGRVRLDPDFASLQLAFYLASWGMYRGGSFLLWKDYKLHSYAIRELFSHKYDDLWYLDYATVRDRNHTVGLLLALVENLRNTYISHIQTVNGVRQRVNVTDALVTKILLGTMACTPAYDEFVSNGLYADHIPYSYLNERNVLALWDYCLAHDSEFRRVQRRLRENGVKYPIMKLVDMYFWMRGQRVAARWRST